MESTRHEEKKADYAGIPKKVNHDGRFGSFVRLYVV